MTTITHCDGGELLPGRGQQVIALFWRRGDPRSEVMLAHFSAMAWPRGYRLCAVAIDEASPALRRWLAVDEPTVAIVADGIVLAMDQACDADSCSRLLAIAQQQAVNIEDL
jgi:hypothetical protein